MKLGDRDCRKSTGYIKFAWYLDRIGRGGSRDELLDESLSEVIHPSVDGDFLRIGVSPCGGDGLRPADVVDLLEDVCFDDLVHRLGGGRALGQVEGVDEFGEGFEPAGERCFVGLERVGVGVGSCVVGCLEARGCTATVGVAHEDDCKRHIPVRGGMKD